MMETSSEEFTIGMSYLPKDVNIENDFNLTSSIELVKILFIVLMRTFVIEITDQEKTIKL